MLPASPPALDPAALRRGDTVCEVGAGVEALGLVAAGSVYIESCDAWGERSLLGAVEAGQIFAEAYACLPGSRSWCGWWPPGTRR